MTVRITDLKEAGQRAFELAHEGFTLGPQGLGQPWAEQTEESKRRWAKVELGSFAECLKIGGVHYLHRKPVVIEASEPMDGKSDWALTIEWPDGTETVELVSTAAAAMLGYHPAKGETCMACSMDLDVYDLVFIDHDNGGFLHAACCGPERECYRGPDGEPLKPGEPIPAPRPYLDAMNPMHMKLARDVTPDIESVCRQVAARFACTVPVSGDNLCDGCWLPYVAAVEFAKRTLDDRPDEMTAGRALYEVMFPSAHQSKLYSLPWAKAGLLTRVLHEFAAQSATVVGRQPEGVTHGR